MNNLAKVVCEIVKYLIKMPQMSTPFYSSHSCPGATSLRGKRVWRGGCFAIGLKEKVCLVSLWKCEYQDGYQNLGVERVFQPLFSII